MSLENPNDNYPDGTWNGDPRAPWNQPSAGLDGITCGTCTQRVPAPSEWMTREFAWCPCIEKWVTPDMEACSDHMN